MKRNAIAAAVPADKAMKNKVQKSKNISAAVTTTKESISTAKFDTNTLSEGDKQIIHSIDARLQDLYYLIDEDDFIGFC